MAQRLVAEFDRDPLAAAAIVDGLEPALTIDAAIGALREAVATLQQHHAALPTGLQITIRTADGNSVNWNANTGLISLGTDPSHGPPSRQPAADHPA